MYQTKANPVDIDLIINFLSGSEANTTGIAQSIQAQLISEGILKKQTEKTPAMQLDFMGADTRPGLFWNSLSVFTHVNYIRSQLREAGLKNVLPSLEGFGSAGYSSSDTNPFPINDALGSPSDYKNLAQSYPNFTLGLSYFGKNKPDNIKDSNLLQSITGGNVQALAAKSYPELTARDVKYIKELGVKQVNVAGLGQDLSSDYSADPTNRSQAIDLQEKALANLAQAGISIDGEQSNLYAWKYLKSISYLPNNDSFFIYETRAVPFIQTVLKGYLPYYSQAANQVSDGRDWLLTNLMNGAMPSYELSEATSQAFEKTSLAYVYNTNYANLKTEILKDYKIYEAIAEATAGAEIVSRYNLTEDGKLTKTAYSNGTVILVNLSGNDYKSGSLSLDKYSYQLVKGEGK
jgi:predicted transcriptional regulator